MVYLSVLIDGCSNFAHNRLIPQNFINTIVVWAEHWTNNKYCWRKCSNETLTKFNSINTYVRYFILWHFVTFLSRKIIMVINNLNLRALLRFFLRNSFSTFSPPSTDAGLIVLEATLLRALLSTQAIITPQVSPPPGPPGPGTDIPCSDDSQACIIPS